MFFGRDKSTQEVPVQDLESALAENFNKKLSGLDSKASRILESIERSKAELGKACKAFRALNNDPDTDFIRASSVTYISDQKEAYANLLERILSSHVRVGGDGTYDFYYSRMQDTEVLLSEIIKANTTFKMVLDAYPNHLGAFKRAFSLLESGWRMLKAEVESRNGEVREFTLLQGHIRSLAALADEQASINSEIRELGEGIPKNVDAADIKSLEEKVTGLKDARKALDRRSSEFNTEIGVILGIIDKPARKHDYLSMYKPKLTHILASPGQLAQPHVYDQFYEQVAEMKAEIGKGVISVKNEVEVKGAIDQILSGKIKELIYGMAEAQSNRIPLDNEIRDLERMVGELNGMINGEAEKESTLASLRERTGEISKEREELKNKISLLFSEYYHKRITIA